MLFAWGRERFKHRRSSGAEHDLDFCTCLLGFGELRFNCYHGDCRCFASLQTPRSSETDSVQCFLQACEPAAVSAGVSLCVDSWRWWGAPLLGQRPCGCSALIRPISAPPHHPASLPVCLPKLGPGSLRTHRGKVERFSWIRPGICPFLLRMPTQVGDRHDTGLNHKQ